MDDQQDLRYGVNPPGGLLQVLEQQNRRGHSRNHFADQPGRGQQVSSANTSSNGFPPSEMVEHPQQTPSRNQRPAMGDWLQADNFSTTDFSNFSDGIPSFVEDYVLPEESSNPVDNIAESPAVRTTRHGLNSGGRNDMLGTPNPVSHSMSSNPSFDPNFPAPPMSSPAVRMGPLGWPALSAFNVMTTNPPFFNGQTPSQQNPVLANADLPTGDADFLSNRPSVAESHAPLSEGAFACARNLGAVAMVADLSIGALQDPGVLLNIISEQPLRPSGEPSEQPMRLPIGLSDLRANVNKAVEILRLVGRIDCQTHDISDNTLAWVVNALRASCAEQYTETSRTVFEPLPARRPRMSRQPESEQSASRPSRRQQQQESLALQRMLRDHLRTKYQRGCERSNGDISGLEHGPDAWKCPHRNCTKWFSRSDSKKWQGYIRHIEVWDPAVALLCSQQHDRLDFCHRKEHFKKRHRDNYHPESALPSPILVENPTKTRMCPRCKQRFQGWKLFYKEHLPTCYTGPARDDDATDWSPFASDQAEPGSSGHRTTQNDSFNQGQANPGSGMAQNHAAPANHASYFASSSPSDPIPIPFSSVPRPANAEPPSRATALWRIVQNRMLPLRASARAQPFPGEASKSSHQSLRQLIDVILVGAIFHEEQCPSPEEKSSSADDIEKDMNHMCSVDSGQVSSDDSRPKTPLAFAARHNGSVLCSRRVSSWPLSASLAACPQCNRLGCVERCKINKFFEVKQGLIRRRTEDLQAWHPWSIRIDFHKYLPWLTTSPTPSLTRSTTSLDPDDSKSTFVDTFQSLILDAGRGSCHTEDDDSLTDSGTVKMFVPEDWPIYWPYVGETGRKGWRFKQQRSPSYHARVKNLFNATPGHPTLDKSVIYEEPDAIVHDRVEEVTDGWPLDPDSVDMITPDTSQAV